MTVESTSADAEAAFRWSLNVAITTGLRPSMDAGLSAATRNAIERVARDHPEADARVITDAYDAFALEHGVPTVVPESDPKESRASRLRRTRRSPARAGNHGMR